MRNRMKKFAYVLLLAIHLIMVFVVPVVPWLIALAHPTPWLIALAVVVFMFIQLPIMIYASTKEHSIVEKLLHKIESFHN